MEDKNMLNDEKLEKVSGGLGNHEFEFGNTLTQLNENQDLLSKSLSKLSTGTKVNSSADDSSGYQISERMRVQIRALD